MNFLKKWKEEKDISTKSLSQVAAKGLVFFLLFLILFYMLSSVSASLTTPMVTVSKPKEGEVAHKTSIEGSLEAEITTPVFVKEGVPVVEVAVRSGDLVEEGQTLFRYDPQKLQEAIAQKKLEVQSAQIEYQVALQNQSNAAARSENGQSDAEVNEDLQLNASNLQVEKAKAELDAAKKALNDAEKNQKSANNSNQNTNSATGQPQTVPGPATVPSGTTPAGASGEDPSAGLASSWSGGSGATSTSGSSSTDSSALDALKNDYRLKQYAYEEAIGQREKAMEEAGRAVRDSKIVDASATARTLGINVQLKKMELSILEGEVVDGGEVKAPISGMVSSVSVETGKLTPSTSAVSLSNQKSLIYKGEVSKDQLKYISRKDTLTCKVAGESKALTDLPIEDIRPIPDKVDQYYVYATLPENMGSLGESVKATVLQKGEKYDLTVPISSVYQGDGDSYYVYTVEETQSVRGTITVTKKVEVTVEDKNSETAAVTGALTSSSLVVSGSETPLKDQMTVRMS